MSSVWPKYSVSDFSSFERPRAVAMTRGLPNGDDFFEENWPNIGALGPTGVPGNDCVGPFPLGITLVMATSSFPGGWLYIHVATRTVVEPMTKDGVIRKPNSATDARNERTIERLVAKPFRILSEYLMTIAVISPPRT